MNQRILGARLVRWMALPLASAFFLAGCSREKLLEVQTPDQLPVDLAKTPVGANGLRVAAIGNFAAFYGGDVGGSGVGLNVVSGLLTDEFESARGGTEHLDTRALNEATFPVTSPWSFAGQATTQLIRATRAIKQYAPEGTAAEKATKSTQLAQLYLYLGYSHILLAEAYCNGIPLANADDENPKSALYSNVQLYNLALAELDTAMTTAGTTTADTDIKNAATVGKARAIVDLATSANKATEYAKAAALVANVPTSFVYNVLYSASSSNIVNSVYDWMLATLNFAPPEKEGGNGLPFLSANDPRVTVRRTAAGAVATQRGQDGLSHAVQTVFSATSSPIPLASGIEARLIEAEAALAAGNNVIFLQKLNDARATRTDLPALADAGTASARLDQLMYERGFWFYGTSHRIGDLRRLIRQYGRTQDQVYPTGPYFKGGAYGTDIVLVPSQPERNNPIYKGCADKNA